MIPHVLRKPNETDTAFIFATWLNNYRRLWDKRHVRSRVYFKYEKERVQDILESAQTTMICNPEDPNHIFGWATYSILPNITVIHYAFMKEQYRNFGIMRSFLTSLPGDKVITHLTPKVNESIDKWGLIYNPYLVDLILRKGLK